MEDNYKLTHKREWNTEKYSASASHIQLSRNTHCVIKTEEVGYKTKAIDYVFIPLVVRASDW